MRYRLRLSLLLVFASVLAVTLPSTAPAAERHQARADTCDCECATRTQDTVWLISTRHLGCLCQYDPNNPDFQVMRYDWETGWEDSDFDSFLDTNGSAAVTAVFVHGNRSDWCKAINRGMLAYNSLVQGVDDPRPIRFVIWSWPSTPTRGLVRDARVKAARCDYDSHYLARFLSQLNPETHVGLFGHSFGSRIITGALHLIGGGEILGLGLDNARPKANHTIRVVLMAAALHNYWLLPGCYHGECLSQVDRMLVQYNPCDWVLQRYPVVDPCTRAQALGDTGLPWLEDLGEDASRIEQQNVCCQVGQTHDMRAYFASPVVMNELRRCILWQ